MPTINTDDLLTSTQVAAILNVKPSTLSNWKNRDPSFPKPVWNNYYSKRELRKWLRVHYDLMFTFVLQDD